MSRSVWPLRTREAHCTVAPFALAVIVVLLSALLYLELVAVLLEYAG